MAGGRPPDRPDRWFYVQLPTGLAGRFDPGVQDLLRGARCLGFRATVVPSPPPKEAIRSCRAGA
ncbi:MAG: hypothetical protein IH936_14855 [Acidobacteria bacterium]|nr:hypothetical protein [Acidobacteriota bacterium]